MASLLDLAQARLGGLLAPQQRPSMVGLLGGQRPQGTLASTIAGYTPPQMQAMSNQQVMDYARTVAQTAQQNLQTQMSDLDKALIMGQQGIQVGDREALARLMEQVPGLMGATAYHGTPHTIRGKFDISKVGTGEGAQAYGHGMYFAESKDLADVYRKKLTNEAGVPVKNPNESIQLQIGNLENQIKKLKQSNDPNAGPMIKAYQSRIDEINKAGNLYKVDIPDEYIPNMLDWDKPLAEQTPEVKAAIEKLGDRFRPLDEMEAKNVTGERLYRRIENSLGKYYGNQANPDASALLNSVGIRGVRYLDEGSREAGKGTSNFVVFDPTDVKILEKNSQKVEGLLD